MTMTSFNNRILLLIIVVLIILCMFVNGTSTSTEHVSFNNNNNNNLNRQQSSRLNRRRRRVATSHLQKQQQISYENSHNYNKIRRRMDESADEIADATTTNDNNDDDGGSTIARLIIDPLSILLHPVTMRLMPRDIETILHAMENTIYDYLNIKKEGIIPADLVFVRLGHTYYNDSTYATTNNQTAIINVDKGVASFTGSPLFTKDTNEIYKINSWIQESLLSFNLVDYLYWLNASSPSSFDNGNIIYNNKVSTTLLQVRTVTYEFLDVTPPPPPSESNGTTIIVGGGQPTTTDGVVQAQAQQEQNNNDGSSFFTGSTSMGMILLYILLACILLSLFALLIVRQRRQSHAELQETESSIRAADLSVDSTDLAAPVVTTAVAGSKSQKQKQRKLQLPSSSSETGTGTGSTSRIPIIDSTSTGATTTVVANNNSKKSSSPKKKEKRSYRQSPRSNGDVDPNTTTTTTNNNDGVTVQVVSRDGYNTGITSSDASRGSLLSSDGQFTVPTEDGDTTTLKPIRDLGHGVDQQQHVQQQQQQQYVQQYVQQQQYQSPPKNTYNFNQQMSPRMASILAAVAPITGAATSTSTSPLGRNRNHYTTIGGNTSSGSTGGVPINKNSTGSISATSPVQKTQSNASSSADSSLQNLGMATADSFELERHINVRKDMLVSAWASNARVGAGHGHISSAKINNTTSSLYIPNAQSQSLTVLQPSYFSASQEHRARHVASTMQNRDEFHLSDIETIMNVPNGTNSNNSSNRQQQQQPRLLGVSTSTSDEEEDDSDDDDDDDETDDTANGSIKAYYQRSPKLVKIISNSINSNSNKDNDDGNTSGDDPVVTTLNHPKNSMV